MNLLGFNKYSELDERIFNEPFYWMKGLFVEYVQTPNGKNWPMKCSIKVLSIIDSTIDEFLLNKKYNKFSHVDRFLYSSPSIVNIKDTYCRVLVYPEVIKLAYDGNSIHVYCVKSSCQEISKDLYIAATNIYDALKFVKVNFDNFYRTKEYAKDNVKTYDIADYKINDIYECEDSIVYINPIINYHTDYKFVILEDEKFYLCLNDLITNTVDNFKRYNVTIKFNEVYSGNNSKERCIKVLALTTYEVIEKISKIFNLNSKNAVIDRIENFGEDVDSSSVEFRRGIIS
jgi:hypothetical protein